MSPENIRKAYFLKISENLWFSNVFSRFINGAFDENGSIELIAKYELSICSFVACLVESGSNLLKKNFFYRSLNCSRYIYPSLCYSFNSQNFFIQISSSLPSYKSDIKHAAPFALTAMEHFIVV